MQAGRDAFSAGKTLDDCPYTDPDLAAAWRVGMKEAAREAITTSLGKVMAVRRMLTGYRIVSALQPNLRHTRPLGGSTPSLIQQFIAAP